jgi:hypothetical protein
MKRGDKFINVLNFIEYISKGMRKEDMLLLYKVNNIKREILELLSDFIFYLNDLIITTYLGDDITTKVDKKKHFKWCWDKVINSFRLEGIYFFEPQELYNYFLNFYQESFYEENKENKKVVKIFDFWENVLSYSTIKTMSEYESMLEVYKIFKKSFVVN